uniref:LamB/YcsF family protein n=1 Tax=Granulicoccus phenolivorans TaxID=266854 RepID=UPI001B7FD03E|nr:5-oxoprolinase subunit PxpA [Granulicoccus phenolivorans]
MDLNADLGEAYGAWQLGDDTAMLTVVTSANVACGFHAGDPLTIRRTVVEAARLGVRVGAQVSYPDLAGFGRRFMDLSADELAADVLYQLGALDGMCRAAGTRIAYVKPHGALYNRVVADRVQAGAVLDALDAFDPELPILGLPGSALLGLAGERGRRGVAEAFADRAYQPDGSLVSRREPGAVLLDAATIAERMVALATTGELTAVDGTRLVLQADSICVHGDSPDAVGIARAVRTALAEAGVSIEAFG